MLVRELLSPGETAAAKALSSPCSREKKRVRRRECKRYTLQSFSLLFGESTNHLHVDPPLKDMFNITEIGNVTVTLSFHVGEFPISRWNKRGFYFTGSSKESFHSYQHREPSLDCH